MDSSNTGCKAKTSSNIQVNTSTITNQFRLTVLGWVDKLLVGDVTQALHERSLDLKEMFKKKRLRDSIFGSYDKSKEVGFKNA